MASSRARITSDFPSANEVAARLGIPSRRVEELRKLLSDIHIAHPDGSATIVEIKNARRSKPPAGQKSEKTVRGRAPKKKR